MSKALNPAIARIQSSNGSAVGVGVLVSDRHIVTCAHVVSAALGNPGLCYQPEIPTEEVHLQFPFVAKGEVLKARAIVWQPAQDDPEKIPEEGEDIAVLELAYHLPAKAKPAAIAKVNNTVGHRFSVFGYPASHNTSGIWAEGKISNQLPNQRVQVEGIKAQGVPIEAGFSGSPVWDEKLGIVVGIMVAADNRPELRVAFLIPTQVLYRAWSNLPVRNITFSEGQIRKLWYDKRRRTIWVSFCILLMGLIFRAAGGLESIELALYDHFMRSRSRIIPEQQDERLAIIEINQRDLRRFGNITHEDLREITGILNNKFSGSCHKTSGASLPDCVYEAIFTRLEKYDPHTIGLDVYRADFSADQGFEVSYDAPGLEQFLSTSNNIFFVCKASVEHSESEDIVAPPPQASLNRVGFSDFVGGSELESTIRRHLLWMKIEASPEEPNPCPAHYAFNMMLAFHYLGLEPDQFENEFENEFKVSIGEGWFPVLESSSGGYQGVDAGGYQILLNYRAPHNENNVPSPNEISQRITLENFFLLPDEQLTALLEDRIVLIGIAKGAEDLWRTPYDVGEIRGVVMHAQMVSQILSAAQRDVYYRPLLWVWLDSDEVLWILVWFSLGCITVWFLHDHPFWLGGSLFFSILSLYLICAATFIWLGGWIPLVPAEFALITPTIVSIFVYTRFRPTPTDELSSNSD